jgi:hypothetical protein
MDKPPTHINTDDAGWIVNMPLEMAEIAGVPEGSFIVFRFKEGSVVAEILPPPTDKLRAEVQEIADEFSDAFTEMKRRGD